MFSRYILVGLTFFFITWMGIKHCVRINNQVTNIDQLDSLAKEIKLVSGPHKNLYFLSGSNSVELYFKTQFAFAPMVVVKTSYNDIPKDSLIVFVTDLHSVTESVENEKIGTESQGLKTLSNEWYQFKLIKK